MDTDDLSNVPGLTGEALASVRRGAADAVKGWLRGGDEAAILATIDRIGADAIAFAADQARRLVAAGGGTERAEAILGELRTLVETLHAPPVPPRRFWGRPPPPPDPAMRLSEAEPRLGALLDRLARERDAMMLTEVSLSGDRARLVDADARLQAAVQQLRALESAATAVARELGGSDPATAATMRGPVALRLQERQRDVLTQLVVTRQGGLSLDLLADGSAAVIGAIDRTRHTLMAALRTAIGAACALADAQALAEQAAAFDRVAAAGAPDDQGARRALDDALAQMRAAIDASSAR